MLFFSQEESLFLSVLEDLEDDLWHLQWEPESFFTLLMALGHLHNTWPQSSVYGPSKTEEIPEECILEHISCSFFFFCDLISLLLISCSLLWEDLINGKREEARGPSREWLQGLNLWPISWTQDCWHQAFQTSSQGTWDQKCYLHLVVLWVETVSVQSQVESPAHTPGP